METIYIDIDKREKLKTPLATCIGYFDGIHRGHQALINKTKTIAKENSLKSALITFYPDPFEVINKGKVQKHIQDFQSRLKIIASYEIDYCIVFGFSAKLAKQDPDDFLNLLLDCLNIKAMVCGYDFHYGHMGKGDSESLRRACVGRFSVDVVPEVSYQNQKISSTRIRQAIECGDMPLVSELLAYDFFIKGQVVHGLGNGHRLGFPTANIQYDKEVILPLANKVYRGYCKVNGKYYKAMINYGNNPSIKHDNPYTLEAYLLDYDGVMYGQEVYLYFKEILRDEVHFNHLADLINQLKNDRLMIEKSDNDGRFIL